MDSSSDHRLLHCQSYLQRTTADSSCVWTTEPSSKRSPIDRGDAGKDLSNAYHVIQTKDSEEYKTPCRPWYGQFESRVMPFGLTNPPATTPVKGDTSSGEQRPGRRVMTLPELPEWRTRVHLMTEKSSGTRRAGTCVPEESSYTPSIRKMINTLDISRSPNITIIQNQLPESLQNKLPESLHNGLPSCLQSCRPRSQPESHQSFLPNGHYREAVYAIITESRSSEIEYNAASERDSAPYYS